MTSHLSPINFPQFRFLFTAKRLNLGAAGVETATAGRIDRRGNFAFQQKSLPPGKRVGIRDGREQGLGVWVVWLLKNFLHRARLDELAEVHHYDLIRDVIMSNKSLTTKKFIYKYY
jgi:hypothetical protein